MRTNQIQGTHYIGADTREMFPKIAGVLKWLPEETAIEWFSSESKATTDIPNEVRITSRTTTDPVTTAVLGESVALQADAANYRFTDLNDRVRSNGWSITAPFKLAKSTLTLKGGGAHSDKSRSYQQTEFTLGPPSGTDAAALQGPIDQVFSDANVTANDFIFLRNDSNAETYLAATMTDAAFGMVDWTLQKQMAHHRRRALGELPAGRGELESIRLRPGKPAGHDRSERARERPSSTPTRCIPRSRSPIWAASGPRPSSCGSA